MKHCLRLLLPLFIYLLPYTAQSQNCSSMVFGTLRDARDRSVLPGASIQIKETGTIVTTDNDGHYHFENICNGKYNLQVTYVGFNTKNIVLTVKGKKELDVMLVVTSTQLSDVQVAATRAERKPLQVTDRLDSKALERTRGQSLGEALKVIPGVNSIQTGPNISKPVIQGMYGNRVLISNAGVRQEGQQWGSEHAPEIDPFVANQITVVKGAASVQYGADAIGGVILVEPAALSFQSGLSGKLNAAAMSNSGLGALSVQLEDSPDKNNHLSWRLQGTTRIAGNTKTPNYYLKNTGLREYNGALSLGYHNNGWTAELFASTFNTKLGIFTGSNVGSTADRNNAINRSEPLEIYQSDLNYNIDRPYQKVNHHLAKLKVSRLFEDAGTLNVQYSYQQDYREEYDIVRASSENRYQYQFDLSTQVADVYFEHQPISGFNGRVGVNGIMQKNFYDGAYLIPFFKSYNGAAYIIEHWRKNNLELEGGLRYDQKWMRATKRINPRDNNSPLEQPEFNFNQFTGTLGAAYNLPAGYRLSATAAKGWRPPAINELFIEGVHQGNAAFERGDRNLRDESSFNLSAGISRQSGKLTGNLNFYHNLIDNYIYLQPQLDSQGQPIFEITQRGGFLSYQYVQVNARFAGFDGLVSYQLMHQIKLTGKYATVRAYNRQTDEHLIYIPADKSTGMVSYQLPGTKEFKATVFDLSVTHVARQFRVNDNQDFLPAPAGYTLVDAAVSTTIPVHGYQWSLSLSVNNLLNKEYRDYLNRFRYYSADIGRNLALRLQIPFGKNNKSQ
jgi:iron complex outermembrane receptor protein